MERRNPWLTYAAVMMFIAAALYVLWAVNLWSDSAWVSDISNGVLGTKGWLWGLFDAALLPDGNGFPSSDHRLVAVDVRVPHGGRGPG